MPPKRVSLTDTELDIVRSIQGLLDMKARQEQVSNLAALLKKLKSMTDNSQSDSSSDSSQEHSERMNISRSGELDLKPDAVSRATKTDSVGTDELWSADALHRHLCLLQGLVPRENEVPAYMRIEAFFYRLAAMIPSMVLSVEPSVPSVDLTSRDTPSKWVNWMTIVTSEDGVHNPRLRKLKEEESVLFVSEVNGPGLLEDHVPHVVSEMFGRARIAEKDIIRGALTNGHSWMFLILTLDKKGGGSFLCSSELSILPSLVRVGDKEAVSVIVAIMAYWMTHSHEALDIDDDYFTYRNV